MFCRFRPHLGDIHPVLRFTFFSAGGKCLPVEEGDKPREIKGRTKPKMNNEEKILSMLDVIARQVTILTETTATKDDLQRVRAEMATKEELQAFRAETHEEFLKVRNEMVTKNDFLRFQEQVHERFDRSETENTRAHEAILAKIDEQSRAFDAKFDVLNDRVFDQEAELRVLKKRAAL